MLARASSWIFTSPVLMKEVSPRPHQILMIVIPRCGYLACVTDRHIYLCLFSIVTLQQKGVPVKGYPIIFFAYLLTKLIMTSGQVCQHAIHRQKPESVPAPRPQKYPSISRPSNGLATCISCTVSNGARFDCLSSNCRTCGSNDHTLSTASLRSLCSWLREHQFDFAVFAL
jgi:hypothetical protein